MTHLVVAVTAHGFGHAAQVAPVVDELWRRNPALRLTLVTELPESLLRARIEAPFAYVAHAADFGLCMKSAFEVDLRASFDRYLALHADWRSAVQREARFLAALAPDCLLADVPYLTLAAAQRLGVKRFALCSLNWADVFEHYFGGASEAARCLEQMRDAYRSADLFIRPAPAMPMTWLDNAVAVGAIARAGRRRREKLCSVAGLSTTARVLLVAPGGIETRMPVEAWGCAPDLACLVPDGWATGQRGLLPVGSIPMSFADILASVDCVLGKCGYGTVTECVASATPLAYIPRHDWPEEPCLIDWLRRHDAGVPVDAEALARGGLAAMLDDCSRLTVHRAEARGAVEAADLLQRHAQLSGDRP